MAPAFRVCVAIGAVGMLLAGCSGQTSPPTPDEITQHIQYFLLPGVAAPDGRPVECVLYDSGTNDTNQSKSWFSFACDFDGKARFPR